MPATAGQGLRVLVLNGSFNERLATSWLRWNDDSAVVVATSAFGGTRGSVGWMLAVQHLASALPILLDSGWVDRSLPLPFNRS